MLIPYKNAVLSITSDNGGEFAEHQTISKKLSEGFPPKESPSPKVHRTPWETPLEGVLWTFGLGDSFGLE